MMSTVAIQWAVIGASSQLAAKLIDAAEVQSVWEVRLDVGLSWDVVPSIKMMEILYTYIGHHCLQVHCSNFRIGHVADLAGIIS